MYVELLIWIKQYADTCKVWMDTKESERKRNDI